MKIVNQIQLAEEAGITVKHLSSIINRRSGGSEKLYRRLEELTEIKAIHWAVAPKPSIKKKVRQFFADQKIQRLARKVAA